MNSRLPVRASSSVHFCWLHRVDPHPHRSTKLWASVRREWGARSSQWPTTRRRRGGIRQAQERGRSSTASLNYTEGQDEGQGSWGVSFALPSLGISYHRLQLSSKLYSHPRRGPTRRTSGGFRPHYVLNQVGATVGQSFGDHLIVGPTVRLVHRGPEQRRCGPGSDGNDRAGQLGDCRQAHTGVQT